MPDWVGERFQSCWHFAKAYYADRGLDIELAALSNQALFLPVEEPQNGDLVLIETLGMTAHCGIYHYGAVLHDAGNMGVIRERLGDIRSPCRFYRHRGAGGSR